MGLRIHSNTASLTAQRYLSQVSEELSGSYRRLASGLRVERAADDASGLGVAMRMQARSRSLQAARGNVRDAQSMAQTMEGALAEVSGLLVRMRELAVGASSGEKSDADRVASDEEYQALIEEIDRIASNTDFNGIALLDGSEVGVGIQVGVDAVDVFRLNFHATRASDLDDLDTTRIDRAVWAQEALDNLDNAIGQVSLARGSVGADLNRLSSMGRSLEVARESVESAKSRILDADIAAESAALARHQIVQQAAASVLAQANVQPQLALQLLGG